MTFDIFEPPSTRLFLDDIYASAGLVVGQLDFWDISALCQGAVLLSACPYIRFSSKYVWFSPFSILAAASSASGTEMKQVAGHQSNFAFYSSFTLISLIFMSFWVF